jgi:hypothetical protein
LLDLCNVSIVHRFSSPKWFSTLKEHLAVGLSLRAPPKGQKGGGREQDGDDRPGKSGPEGLFAQICTLATGEALLFCPTALLAVNSAVHPASLSMLDNVDTDDEDADYKDDDITLRPGSEEESELMEGVPHEKRQVNQVGEGGGSGATTSARDESGRAWQNALRPVKLQDGYAMIKVRKRITADGGRSKMAV